MQCFFQTQIIVVDFTGFLGLCFKAEKFKASDGEFDGLLVVAAVFFGFVLIGGLFFIAIRTRSSNIFIVNIRFEVGFENSNCVKFLTEI